MQTNQSAQSGTTRVERKIVRLIERDGPNCVWCGRECIVGGTEGSRATLDHIIPRSLCRSDHLDVLVLACFDCNNTRGSQSINVFIGEAKTPEVRLLNRAIDRARRFMRVRAGLYVG